MAILKHMPFAIKQIKYQIKNYCRLEFAIGTYSMTIVEVKYLFTEKI